MVTQVTCNASNNCNASNSITFTDKKEHLLQLSDTLSLVSDKRQLWATLQNFLQPSISLFLICGEPRVFVANLAHPNALDYNKCSQSSVN